MKSCCVLGLGYIGLPTALLIAKFGYKVVGVDTNKSIVNDLNKGKCHVKEKGLSDLLWSALRNNKFKAFNKPIHSDIFIIAVPTPFCGIINGIPKPNLDYVFAAIDSISSSLKKNNIVIIESTCPVGTTNAVADYLYRKTGFGLNEIDISYCPERVIPGNILFELENNNRVIGGVTNKSALNTLDFYKTFCKGKLKLVSSKTAEMVKLAENSYRDVNIAFANEISMICDDEDIKPEEVIEIANMHPRVNILNPSCGVGGHCIAVDPWFIVSRNPQKAKLIKVSRQVNLEKTDWVFSRIIDSQKNLEKKIGRKIKIGIFGITYKANVLDLRESPALKIFQKLIDSDLQILLCEPNIDSYSNFKSYSINYALSNSDLCIFLVGHKEFQNIKFNNYKYLDFCGIK